MQHRTRIGGVVVTGASALAVIVGVVLLFFVVSAFTGFWVMLLWGAIGSSFDIEGKWRTISYGQAFVIGMVMTLLWPNKS